MRRSLVAGLSIFLLLGLAAPAWAQDTGTSDSDPFVVLTDYIAELPAQQSPLAAGQSRQLTVVVYVGTDVTSSRCPDPDVECTFVLEVVELGPVDDSNIGNNHAVVPIQST